MLHLLYNIAIRLYGVIAKITALFDEKASKWVKGRRSTLDDLSRWRASHPGKNIWIHCASLGEFEQGRPVIEALKNNYPEFNIVLTFFSPSGYEVRKNYPLADFICYLPNDTPSQTKEFIQTLRPEIAIFVKYEYWANYFFECKRKSIPLFILSGILRKDQRFFGVLSSFWGKVLECVTHFFVQNEETKKLLSSIGFSNITISGDNRFDRVISIANKAEHFIEIDNFKNQQFCVIVGSSWPQEEKYLKEWLKKPISANVKLILVPHEINKTHIADIEKLFPNSARWSERESVNLMDYNVLIVDTIGMLSSIYQYADVAIIGGGFGKGIHNTLEAAVWGVPVLFGPNYGKFEEAKQLIQAGGAFSFQNETALSIILQKFINQTAYKQECALAARNYVLEKGGATQKFIVFIARIFNSK